MLEQIWCLCTMGISHFADCPFLNAGTFVLNFKFLLTMNNAFIIPILAAQGTHFARLSVQKRTHDHKSIKGKADSAQEAKDRTRKARMTNLASMPIVMPSNGATGRKSRSRERTVEELSAKISRCKPDGNIFTIVDSVIHYEKDIFPPRRRRRSNSDFEAPKLNSLAIETKRLRTLICSMLLKDYFADYTCTFPLEVTDFYAGVASCMHKALSPENGEHLSLNWTSKETISRLADILRAAVQDPACALDVPTDLALCMILRLRTKKRRPGVYKGCIISMIEAGKIQALAEKLWIDQHVLLEALEENLPKSDLTMLWLLKQRMKEVEEQHFKYLGIEGMMLSIPVRARTLSQVHHFIGDKKWYAPKWWLNKRIEIARQDPRMHPKTTTVSLSRRLVLPLMSKPKVKKTRAWLKDQYKMTRGIVRGDCHNKKTQPRKDHAQQSTNNDHISPNSESGETPRPSSDEVKIVITSAC